MVLRLAGDQKLVDQTILPTGEPVTGGVLPGREQACSAGCAGD